MPLSHLCQQLLVYSGKGKFLIEPVNLNEITLEMSQLLEAAISKKTVVLHEFAENLPFINADATQIRQVVMNLITNASEAFMGDGGSIRVSTGEVFCDEASLNETEIGEDLRAGDYVFLKVQDWGCGMDGETVQKIFEPFFTTKFTGRGLGLSSVLGIVRSHHGAMRVLSQPGKGTTFTLYFPKIESAPHKEPVVDLPGAFDWQGEGTVLLVDDDEVVRAAAKRVLEKMGFHVALAADGHEAV
ncbi:hypothetical protein IIC65_00290, partial [Candidatus Sumerlaeota bacterium]|nr:hypothetical protein [Candidatus Sumerlaeota bacterium]